MAGARRGDTIRPATVGPMDYLAAVATESDRFAAALDGADPAASVPSCPGWTADDLRRHLADVQWFWARIIIDGVVDDATAAR